MVLSNSSWDRGNLPVLRSPAFSYSSPKVIFEFGNRRSQKTFAHKLGNIEFSAQDLEGARNKLISELYGVRTAAGYKYRSVSHTHILPALMPTDLTVLFHGVPVKGGYENCAMSGATCHEGLSDTKCLAGKCRLGELTRETNRWRFDSLTVPEVYYYLYGTESVQLRPVTRGKFKLPAGSGVVNVSRVASISTTVYLPPITYAEETFTRRVIKHFWRDGSAKSLQDSVDDFVRSLLSGNLATVEVENEVKDKLLDSLRGDLPEAWFSFIESEIETIWSGRFEFPHLTNRDFAIEAYSALSNLYTRAIQVATSSIKTARLNLDSQICRPVYDRLPGVAGAYNDESGDTIAKWLTSGADEQLSKSKEILDNFYTVALNHNTCYPLFLDWIAEHLGFIGPLWDFNWSNLIKRELIKNAHVNLLDTDSGSLFTTENGNLHLIDRSRIETETSQYKRISYDTDTDLSEIIDVDELEVGVSRWPGLIPARGTLITVLVLFKLFGVKAPSRSELEYNVTDGTFSVRSGLRELESDAPVNVPYTTDVIHVGTDLDAEIGNYPNQLIADIAVCYDEKSANTNIVRMPFYYNRNGRTWDTVQRIADNWMPISSVNRVQYSYSAADLLAAEDTFFEPEPV